MKNWKKWAWGFVSFFVFATAFIGWLHTPRAHQYSWARKALASLYAVCPINDKMNAERSDHERNRALARMKGSEPAPTLVFKGFHLGQSSQSDILAWADQNHVMCDAPLKAIRLLKCKEAGRVTSFGFNPAQMLVSIDVYEADVPVIRANEELKAQVRDLRSRLGTPSVEAGEFQFAGSKQITSILQYHFQNMIAEVTATRFSFTGIVLHEQYSLLQ